MKIHDVVIGDFGRVGTLRYFQAFSEAEQELLQEVQNDQFYDEYRQVRYTIVGLLRDIKHRFLPESLEDIDDSVLIGVNGGPAPTDILFDTLKALAPYIVQAVETGAVKVRVIIPCNTLFELAQGLQNILMSDRTLQEYLEKNQISEDWADELLRIMRTTIISVPAVAEIVVAELNDDSTDTLLVSASKAAEKAYKDVINDKHDDITFESWLPEGFKDFSDLLKETISGSEISSKEIHCPSGKKIVSGCTDIELPFGEDSTEIFARHLAKEAYQALQII